MDRRVVNRKPGCAKEGMREGGKAVASTGELGSKEIRKDIGARTLGKTAHFGTAELGNQSEPVIHVAGNRTGAALDVGIGTGRIESRKEISGEGLDSRRVLTTHGSRRGFRTRRWRRCGLRRQRSNGGQEIT